VQELRTVVRKPQVPRLCVAESYTAGTPSPEFFRRRCPPFELLAVVVARESAPVLQLGSKRHVLQPGAFRVANRALGLFSEPRWRSCRRAPPSPVSPPPAVRLWMFSAVRHEICGSGRAQLGQRVGQLESNLS
jgi:hypothetical protein